jgi:S-adenosylmethionine/arginine decarboxylase-like enzyme
MLTPLLLQSEHNKIKRRTHENIVMNGNNGHCDERYRALVKTGFIIKTLLASCLLAYWAGRAARPLLFQSQDQELESPKGSFLRFEGRKYPAYLSQTFDTPRKASSSSWLLNARDTMTLIAEDNTDIEDNKSDGCGGECKVDGDEDGDDDDDEEEAIAEQLMVDIKNVDDSFLNSERRLANALLELVSEAKLTLLSYHCIGLVPMGVSCVGLLKRNYVSLHTWPERGIISLDLCVDGASASLFSVLPIIERIFGVPQTFPLPSDVSRKKIDVNWARRFRGFDHDERANDLSLFVVNEFGADRKNEVSPGTMLPCLLVMDCSDFLMILFLLLMLYRLLQYRPTTKELTSLTMNSKAPRI